MNITPSGLTFCVGDYRYFVGQPRGAYLQINYQFGVI
ncbi:MAG: hypothetical protein ACI835_004314 [Planctomycetota bacterium]|jgi:hypothetical protein